MSRLPLSIVILTKNEEERIAECIESVLGWADEIIVVDDESNDRTREIAADLGAKVLVKKMEIEGRHRNWAYSEARNGWVLSLDADERVTEELKKEIEAVLAKQPLFSAFTIPRRNYIGDYWLRWGGLYPSAQLKLFRKDKFSWEEVEVHPRAFLKGECGHLKKDILHYTYRNWEDYLRKLNKQTTLEAIKWHKLSLLNPRKARYKMNLLHALWRSGDRFIRSFVAKRGYRDGFRGFMVSCLSSLYQLLSYAKYRELKRDEKYKHIRGPASL
ncbi:MAG: glycosyltransferase family 2 protein [Candidatus Omnitrophica bacterium]|nr:glycosyltransferase family 2 protein [Candidatus Omnitrophota bacterium]